MHIQDDQLGIVWHFTIFYGNLDERLHNGTWKDNWVIIKACHDWCREISIRYFILLKSKEEG